MADGPKSTTTGIRHGYKAALEEGIPWDMIRPSSDSEIIANSKAKRAIEDRAAQIMATVPSADKIAAAALRRPEKIIETAAALAAEADRETREAKRRRAALAAERAKEEKAKGEVRSGSAR